MHATMVLCDAAQVAEGKVSLLGGGWTTTGPDPAPSAVVVMFRFDKTEERRIYQWRLSLLNQDGHEVIFGEPDNHENHQHMVFGGEIDTRLAAQDADSIVVPVAINLAPMPLPGGESFVWRLSVDDATSPGWEAPFNVRPGEQSVTASEDSFGPSSLPNF